MDDYKEALDHDTGNEQDEPHQIARTENSDTECDTGGKDTASENGGVLNLVLASNIQLREQLDAVEKAVNELKRGQELVSAKLRELSGSVENVATTFSEPRIRDLLTSLLLLQDLLEQMADKANREDPAADNYRNLLIQIHQILALHGIEIIPTNTRFDGNLHRAVQCIETDDISEAGQINRVIRQGFKSGSNVLRYADVEVKIARNKNTDHH
jgi:molecular chaperone GrpE (heat shock protein)